MTIMVSLCSARKLRASRRQAIGLVQTHRVVICIILDQSV